MVLVKVTFKILSPSFLKYVYYHSLKTAHCAVVTHLWPTLPRSLAHLLIGRFAPLMFHFCSPLYIKNININLWPEVLLEKISHYFVGCWFGWQFLLLYRRFLISCNSICPFCFLSYCGFIQKFFPLAYALKFFPYVFFSSFSDANFKLRCGIQFEIDFCTRWRYCKGYFSWFISQQVCSTNICMLTLHLDTLLEVFI